MLREVLNLLQLRGRLKRRMDDMNGGDARGNAQDDEELVIDLASLYQEETMTAAVTSGVTSSHRVEGHALRSHPRRLGGRPVGPDNRQRLRHQGSWRKESSGRRQQLQPPRAQLPSRRRRPRCRGRKETQTKFRRGEHRGRHHPPHRHPRKRDSRPGRSDQMMIHRCAEGTPSSWSAAQGGTTGRSDAKAHQGSFGERRLRKG